MMLAMIIAGLVAPSTAQAGPGEMWQFADKISQELAPYFSEDSGLYLTPADQVHLSSSMLSVHARAAIAGHQGAARQDQKMRLLARRMINWPIYIEDYNQGSGKHKHAPGFTIGVDRPREQHVSFDMQIGNALSLAVKSGQLEPETEAQIRERLPKVARQPVFTYPEVKLNQVNWPIQVWAATARVDGNYPEANRQVRGQMQQFIDGMFTPMPGKQISNLSRGLGLRYASDTKNSAANKTSTTEYANIIYAGFNVYQEMLDQGMEPLKEKDEAKMKAWAGRLIRGDWTHGGWPNWDSGHGLDRIHLMRYWPWAAEGLATMAAAKRLAEPQDQAYAAWLLEQVLARYSWLAERGTIGATRYGLPTGFGKDSDGPITAARLAAIAARAASQNNAAPKQPGGLWWYDPEMQRFTVTTPQYSAAVMAPISKPAYGGLEITRLLDSQGRVLTSLGATQPQSGISAGGEHSQAQSGKDRAAYRRLTVKGTKTLGKATVSGQTRSGRIRVSHRFETNQITSQYRTSKAGELKIPLWGKTEKLSLKNKAGTIILQSQNSEGAKLKITISSSQALKAKVASFKARPQSPGSRKQLQVKIRKAGELTVKISPQS